MTIEVKNDEMLGRTNNTKLHIELMKLQQELDKYKQMYEMEKALFIDADLKIERAIEYIENHSLYETEYDYDYEENSYLSGIDDETAKKDLLEILKGDKNVKKNMQRTI